MTTPYYCIVAVALYSGQLQHCSCSQPFIILFAGLIYSPLDDLLENPYFGLVYVNYLPQLDIVKIPNIGLCFRNCSLKHALPGVRAEYNPNGTWLGLRQHAS